MTLKIWQIKDSSPNNRYMGWRYINGKPNPDEYDLVWEDNTEYTGLEQIFTVFNLHHPEDYRGRSLSVSDIVEVHDNPNIEDGFWFCDIIGWRKVTNFRKE